MSHSILIVDDDQRLRKLLEDYLLEKKFFIYLSDDFISTKEILKYFMFDLIIVDRMMPTGDGLDLIKIIKKINSTPVIMLTAMGESQDRIQGLEAGVDDYMVKPFEPRELLLRINNILKRIPMDSALAPTEALLGVLRFDLGRLELFEGENIRTKSMKSAAEEYQNRSS